MAGVIKIAAVIKHLDSIERRPQGALPHPALRCDSREQPNKVIPDPDGH